MRCRTASRRCSPWHAQIELLHTAWQRGLNSLQTSTIGQLFDATALLDAYQEASFEGEGPMRLQALAKTVANGPCRPIHWQHTGDLWELDWQPWLDGLLNEQIPTAHRAWALHDALARAASELACRLDLQAGTALGGAGGVFQNSLLAERLWERFPGLQLSQRQPAYDAGMALGQLMECLALDHKETP
ncbi:hypothetical protein GCM10027046_14830 [Uliginosibacterium flavum]|uniref:Carbamoyltransferase Kae1-like domain-containing protein n=1 Tax=Uliginosibacterium flavum TaxID=1396831 RepID=A0ABV2TQI9_9RHOO